MFDLDVTDPAHTRPLGNPPTWAVVVGAAGHQCECKGACGRSHSRSEFRCDRTHDRGGVRLLAAPHDLAVPLAVAAELPADDLRAWCPDCYRLASRRHRDAAAARTRLDAPPVPTLFDL